MKYLMVLLGLFIALTVNGKYLSIDYHQTQDMIWDCGDSIINIDYDKRIIEFTNRGSERYYFGKIFFNTNWISVSSEILYFNYFKGYSVKEYLNTFKDIGDIRICKNCYYIDNICYRVTRKKGKLFITEAYDRLEKV